jgi:hypothetical protein
MRASRKRLSPTLPVVPKKPVGYFRIPPNYWQLREEDRLVYAQIIADRLRQALLAQADERTDAGGEPAGSVRDGELGPPECVMR